MHGYFFYCELEASRDTGVGGSNNVGGGANKPAPTSEQQPRKRQRKHRTRYNKRPSVIARKAGAAQAVKEGQAGTCTCYNDDRD